MRGEEPVSTAEAGRKYGHLAAGRHIMALTGGGELRTADLLKEEKSIAKELGKKKDIHHSSLAKEAATAGEIWSASGETEYPEYQAEAAAEKGVIKGTSTASGHHRPGPARHHQLLKKIAADPEGKGRLESGQVTTELETGEGKASVPAAAMMEWGPQFEEQLKSLKGKQEGGASPEELRAMEKEGASGKFLELAKAREKMKRMIKGGAREHKKWSPADLGKARGMAPAEGVPASGLYEGYEMGEEPYDEYINPEEEEP